MKKDLGNMDLNFEKTLNSSLKENQFCKLFKCFDCGFHPDVISSIYIKGYENEVVHYALKITPSGVDIIKPLSRKKLERDGEMIEEHNCGKCGKSGNILPVPKDILKNMGFKINKDAKQGISNNKSFIKRLKDKIKGNNRNE